MAGPLVVSASTLLVVGTLPLVPGQDGRVLGIELVLVGLAAGVGVVRTRGQRTVEPGHRRNALIVMVMGLIAAGIFTIAGLACAFSVLGGLYWVVPATILTFFAGLVNSWFALIEILR